jgi:5-formyltetrahydrofolate cyclo-ligase
MLGHMDKKDIRRQLLERGQKVERLHPGRLAQLLRQQQVYREAKAVHVSPGLLLSQVRMNVLADGKVLLCPTPGLKEGFHLLLPYTVPFARLAHAVSQKGMREFGKLINQADHLREISVSLTVTDCLAVDEQGVVLGNGKGFLDLSLAILNSWAVLSRDDMVIAVVPEEQLLADVFAADPWDSFADLVLSEEGIVGRGHGQRRPRAPIFWHVLSEKRIRKITPLWKLKQTVEMEI